jgi:hypothetical protein
VRHLGQQQSAFGDACCVELALAGLCNNPSCAALGKSNEARVITSTCSRCKTARWGDGVRFCSFLSCLFYSAFDVHFLVVVTW